ncbi:MAG TPA: DUF1549 domain-containing protein [Planctomycetota bacterium]|nr:DUF1549 domain-containing protein [Planctomycetota bacterium]
MTTIPILAALLLGGQEKGHPLDGWFAAEWARAGVKPGPPADDAAFLRRASLDLTGRLPDPEEVRAFLKSTRRDKRVRTIDQLLASPQAADYFAHLWIQWLMGHEVTDGDLRALDLGGLVRWLKAAWEKDLPYDDLVRALLTSTGSLRENPPANYLAKYIVPGEPPAAAAGHAARLFLASDIRCAQCHDHPFERVTQEDFWSFAAFFRTLARTREGLEELPAPRAGKPREDVGELLAEPRFLDGRTPEPAESRPAALARFILTAPEDLAGRAIVDRVWMQLFGRRLSEDGRPGLQSLLVDLFRRGKGSLRGLVRLIVTSAAWQMSSEGTDAARRAYTAGPLKMMNAVQFMRAWNYAFQYEAYFRALYEKDPAKAPFFEDPDLFWIGQTMAAKELIFPKGRDPEEVLASGTDRLAIKLMNSRDLQLLMVARFQATGQLGLVWKVIRTTQDPSRRLDELFLLLVSRPPTASERGWLLPYVKGVANPFHAWSDVFWMLLNSSEFVFVG